MTDTVAILVNPERPDAAALAETTAGWLSARGYASRLLQLEPHRGSVSLGWESDLTAVDLSDNRLAVSLGGDGTFLRLVPLAYKARVPILGVNFGRLGYLLEVQPDQLGVVLEQTLEGTTAIEERIVLCVTVTGLLTPAVGEDRSLPGDGTNCAVGTRWWVSLNEMVAEKTVPGHMVGLSTAIDGDEFLEYRADGVLVATPTGSTAYNLSAGGPVLSPKLPAMVMTPVAPHLAIERSLVLRADQVASVQVLPGRPAVLVVDGREAGHLAPGATVECRVATDPLRVVCPAERRFAATLRRALTLGART